MLELFIVIISQISFPLTVTFQFYFNIAFLGKKYQGSQLGIELETHSVQLSYIKRWSVEGFEPKPPA